MSVKFANNAVSTLASGISNSATSITVASGNGALFPSLTGSEYFYATLIDALNNLEIVAKDLKNKYACGGTAKEGYIFLQGDHRDTIKDTLVNLGFAEDTIELH